MRFPEFDGKAPMHTLANWRIRPSARLLCVSTRTDGQDAGRIERAGVLTVRAAVKTVF